MSSKISGSTRGVKIFYGPVILRGGTFSTRSGYAERGCRRAAVLDGACKRVRERQVCPESSRTGSNTRTGAHTTAADTHHKYTPTTLHARSSRVLKILRPQSRVFRGPSVGLFGPRPRPPRAGSCRVTRSRVGETLFRDTARTRRRTTACAGVGATS